MAALSAPAANADDSSTLTVVGTSDVSDSNLMSAVIKPGFQAYEQAHGKNVTLNYVGQATGAAIAAAEQGTASALIVHAASLENQFVSQGYSLENYGRAIFWGDFVLLGPAGDPAGVMDGGQPSDDVVGAFEKIAAAGAAGKANFVSRAGSPGTTVDEHAIWAAAGADAGTTLCTVSTANGGGAAPSTTSGDCPSTATPPSWYHITGGTQAPNVENADACNYSGGGCYVLTDRGTYDYLVSTNAISDLKVVVQNAPGAPNSSLLVNSFHLYGINPAKFSADPNVAINVSAATDLLGWLTSPSAQAAVGKYLASSPGGAPFHPDAAPALTAATPPAQVAAGRTVTVTGTLSNVVPGMPALPGETVTLRGAPLAHPTETSTIATGETDATGHYRISFRARAPMALSVGTDGFTQIENATLKPFFADNLQPTTTEVGQLQVVATPTTTKARLSGRKLTISGTLAPAAGANAHISLYGVRGNGQVLHYLARRDVKTGATRYSATFKLGKGKWNYRIVYVDPPLLSGATEHVRKVTVC